VKRGEAPSASDKAIAAAQLSLTMTYLKMCKNTELEIYCIFLGDKEIYHIFKTFHIICLMFHKMLFIS